MSYLSLIFCILFFANTFISFINGIRIQRTLWTQCPWGNFKMGSTLTDFQIKRIKKYSLYILISTVACMITATLLYHLTAEDSFLHDCI
jgi:hypothetical protein